MHEVQSKTEKIENEDSLLILRVYLRQGIGTEGGGVGGGQWDIEGLKASFQGFTV